MRLLFLIAAAPAHDSHVFHSAASPTIGAGARALLSPSGHADYFRRSSTQTRGYFP